MLFRALPRAAVVNALWVYFRPPTYVICNHNGCHHHRRLLHHHRHHVAAEVLLFSLIFGGVFWRSRTAFRSSAFCFCLQTINILKWVTGVTQLVCGSVATARTLLDRLSGWNITILSSLLSTTIAVAAAVSAKPNNNCWFAKLIVYVGGKVETLEEWFFCPPGRLAKCCSNLLL